MKETKLDVLVLAAHPDDAELFAGGTICALTKQGYRVGVVDFTRGERASRGTPELRQAEAARASEIMNLSARENLEIPDGVIENSGENQRRVIASVRRFRPDVILANSEVCRHPDHGDAARLAISSLYYSGLRSIETVSEDGGEQMAWRPQHVLQYMQMIPFEPSVVVDVSAVWEQRMQALTAFGSQFYLEGTKGDGGPETYISGKEFLEWVQARARTYGYPIGATYGEPFLYRGGAIGTDDLMSLLRRRKPFV
jgi:bacillithiol biosynthesis deacetylase BshB1